MRTSLPQAGLYTQFLFISSTYSMIKHARSSPGTQTVLKWKADNGWICIVVSTHLKQTVSCLQPAILDGCTLRKDVLHINRSWTTNRDITRCDAEAETLRTWQSKADILVWCFAGGGIEWSLIIEQKYKFWMVEHTNSLWNLKKASIFGNAYNFCNYWCNFFNMLNERKVQSTMLAFRQNLNKMLNICRMLFTVIGICFRVVPLQVADFYFQTP